MGADREERERRSRFCVQSAREAVDRFGVEFSPSQLSDVARCLFFFAYKRGVESRGDKMSQLEHLDGLREFEAAAGRVVESLGDL